MEDREPRVWRMGIHRQPRLRELALDRCRKEGRVTVGWGRLGDLRELNPETKKDIYRRWDIAYPERKKSGTVSPSLWNFYKEMQVGDLVILKAGQPCAVLAITGEYEWRPELDEANTLEDHWHVRPARELPDLEPLLEWKKYEVAKGQQPLAAVALLTPVAAPASLLPPSED